MHVGTVSESVEVTTEALPCNFASSDIMAVVNATTVRELPLNAAVGRFGSTAARRGDNSDQPTFARAQIAASAVLGSNSLFPDTPQQNNYRLDGVSLNGL